MAHKIKASELTGQRWHSTGFMAGGVASVDAGAHTLAQAVMIRPGEALGHGMWVDKEMCSQVHASAAGVGDAGIKARFGHPNMCSDSLGSFLGRWKNVTVDESGFVRGDLHLSSTAAKSPKGDLRQYIEEMAAKEPNHFGASIVFTRSQDDETKFLLAHGATVDGDYIDLAGFKSPDPLNVNNLPHARLAEIHAADLVDDPAATDGIFSGAGGMSLAGQMTEWLDTHPEVFKALQAPGVLDVIDRYKAELRPFVERYSATATPPEADEQPAPAEQSPAAEPAKTEEAAPAESGELASKVATLTAQAGEAEKQIAQLTGECASHQTRADALTAERDGLSAKVKTMGDEIAELRRKVAAYENGAPPVDAAPAPAETVNSGNLWDDARKGSKK
jgi:hypothetical protein